MIALPHRNRTFMQMCWVVPDLQAAIATWTRTHGVGPFFYFAQVEFGEGRYRGRPADHVNVSAAMAQAGDVQIELVCQNDDKPSFWRDLVPAGQSGFHHVALYCTDYDADLAAYTSAGAEVAFSGLMMGNRVCWVEAKPSLGFMVELVQANPIADSVFAQIRAAAQDWNGKDPVRTFG